MADAAPPQFDTLREAYCAVYRCPAAAFEKRVFWSCLYRHAWLPAHWMWWFEREFFRPDLEALTALGAARSEPDLERAIDDLGNLAIVERSIRRGALLMRLSPSRLIARLRPLVPLLRPAAARPATVVPDGLVGRPVQRASAPLPSNPRERTQAPAASLRQLKRLHSDVVLGRAVEEALRDAGIQEPDIDRLLAVVPPGQPELLWLRTFFATRRELATLRTENAELRRRLDAQPKAAGNG